jgi:5-methylcytosine-specific restriction protein B
MDANRERWHANILEPMRALFADLGPHLKAKFDPYLNPDELEIRPTARYVLARINKNWSATEYSKYHEYYWGAFYRARLTKQTDAQLFVNLLAHTFRFGFYVGEMAKSVRERFQQRVQDDSQAFWELVNRLELAQEFEFVRTHEEDQREVIGIRTADDIHHWVESGDFDLLQRLAPEEAVTLGPALADRIFDALRRVFPVYLWAVAGNPALLVDQYLAAEFPPDEFDDLEEPPTPYTRAEFLRDTHLTAAAADELIEVLQEKKQLIFYGPPGTGKTWVARHLGRLLTGLADPSPERLTVVQFHPAYGYEEFIEGIRPRSEEHDGRRWVDYPTRPGVFVRFCREAARVAGPCVFIIDEINRGNIPRIFGELMLLLEYRDLDVPLPYSGERFRIPPNVYVIGTMNTADRSIALVDFALRRRFHFAKFAADPDLFARWLAAREGALPYLGALYRRLSEEAIDDPNFAIGPSAFMREGLDEAVLARIWRRSVIPYLEEYYFDQPAKARRWDWDGELVRGIREGWGD